MDKETKTNTLPIEEDVGIFIDPRKRALVSIALFVAVFGCNFSFRSYSVALPSIVANWTYSSNLYSAGNSLMTVAMTIVTMIIVRISAKTGIKKTITAGLFIVIACDILTMIAPNMLVFLIIRVLYGVGCGLICGQELSSLNLIWPKADRKKWVGMRGVTYSITNVIGPTVAGMLVDFFGWRSTFVAILFFHVLGLIIFTVCCPKDSKNRFYVEKPFDTVGCIIFSVLITVTVLVCTMGKVLGWGNPLIVLGLAVIVVSFIALLIVENKKGESAVLPTVLFKTNKNFTKLFIITVVSATAGMAPVNFLSLYMQKVGGTNATLSGLPYSIIFISTLFVSYIIGRVGKKFGVKKIMVTCSTVGMVAIGFLATWLSPDIGNHLPVLFTICAVYGLANVFNATLIYDAAAEYVDTANIGVSTSTIYMGITIGGSIGLAVLQLIMNSWTARADLSTGLIAVFWAGFVATVIRTVLCISMKKVPAQGGTEA